MQQEEISWVEQHPQEPAHRGWREGAVRHDEVCDRNPSRALLLKTVDNLHALRQREPVPCGPRQPPPSALGALLQELPLNGAIVVVDQAV
jgi:hypothetical protein